MEQQKEYYAFISYKREDEKWAKWLQDKLEHYKFPTNLNGRTDLPKYIRPTFRDVTDLKPGLLAEEINNALHNSEWLIVVCSPLSAKSPWVCKEAQAYIDFDRADHIIPFVIEGNPFSNDIATECYPEALLNLTGSKELLAANINEMGRDAAAIKVVARMFNLRFDALWQRYEKEKKKRRRQLMAAIILAFLFLLGIAAWIWHQNVLLKEKDWKMMENQARAVAEKAEYLVDNHDSYMARMIIQELFPFSDDGKSRPYIPEMEIALRHAVIHDEAILPGHGGWGMACVISYNANGRYMAVAYLDNTMRVWDTYDGTCLRIIKNDINNDRVTAISLSPDGRYLAYATNRLFVYDIKTENNKRFQQLTEEDVNTISYSPDGKCVAYVSTDGLIGVVNMATGKHVFSQKIKYGVNTIAYSNDGRLLVTSSEDCIVRVWNLVTGKCVQAFVEHGKSITSATISPNNSYVLSACDSTLHLWDIASGKLKKEIRNNADISCATYTPDNKNVLATLADSTIKIWDANTFNIYDSWVIKEGIPFRVECSPDGFHFAFTTISYDGNVYIRELKKRENDEKHFQYGAVHNACLSQDGSFLVTEGSVVEDDGSIQYILNLWDEKMQKCHHSFYFDEIIRCIAFNQNDLIIGLNDGTIQIFDIDKREHVKTIHAHEKGINCLAISPDGRYMITAPYEGLSFKVWNYDTMKCLESTNGHTDAISYISFSPKGDIFATVAEDDTIKIWETSKNRCIRNLVGHTEIVRYLSFSPNGKQIASASDDETIRIWDVKSGKCIHVLKGTPSRVCSIEYSPNGVYLLSAYRNGKVCVWDVKTGYCLQTLRKDGYVGLLPSFAFFDFSGTHIFATSSDNKDLTTWHFPPLQEIIDQTRERFKGRQLTPEERRKYYLE